MTEKRFATTKMSKVMNYPSWILLSEAIDRHSTLPDNARMPPLKWFGAAKGTNLLTSCCLFWLKKELGYYASRNNTTGIPRKQRDGSIKWTRATGGRGTADITGVTSLGISLNVEIKWGKGDKLSPDQIKFRDTIRAMNGIYIEVRRFEDLLTALEELQSKTFHFSATTPIAQKSTISHLIFNEG